MSNHKKTYYLHLTELLQLLQAQGVAIDYEHYEGIKTILESYGPTVTPKEMASLLCPLIVTDQEEQDRFYLLFEQCVNQLEEDHSTIINQDTPELPLPSFANYRKLLALGMFSLVVLVSLGFWLQREAILNKVVFNQIDIKQEAEQRNIKQYKAWNKNASKEDQLKAIKKLLEQSKQVKKEAVDKEDSDHHHAHTEPLDLNLEYLKLKQEDMSAYEVERLWWQEHKALVKWWLAVIVALGFVLIEAYHFSKNRLIARQRKLNKEKPFVLDLDLNQDYAVQYPMHDLHRVAYQLRKRSLGVRSRRLDMKATVKQTVANAGIIDLAYHQPTKIPQYLILIDQASKRNHQWALFEFIARELVKKDLHVERYYFNETPTTCWAEATHNKVPLKYLQKHFADHRLIIFGNSEHFADVATKSLDTIVQELLHWEERVFMNPQNPALWGEAEKLLEDYIPVMQADLKGFGQLIERFESVHTGMLTHEHITDKTEIIDLTEETEEVVANLEYFYLPHDYNPEDGQATIMTWIAACCLLPNVHWDLTLYIGSLLSDSNNYLLTVDNLTRLSNLSWFQDGAIPDRFRKRLLFDEQLLTEAQRQLVAKGIGRLLEERLNDIPSSNQLSAKYRQAYMHLWMNKWFGAANAKEAHKTKRKLKQLWPYLDNKDVLAYELIERKAAAVWDVILPAQMKPFMFKDRFAFTGIRASMRMVIAGVLLLMPFVFINSDFFCDHPVNFKETNYCIVDSYDKAQFINFMAVDDYDPEQVEVGKTLDALHLASKMRNGYTTSVDNIALVQFNQALYHHNKGNREEAFLAYQLLKENRSLKRAIPTSKLKALEVLLRDL